MDYSIEFSPEAKKDFKKLDKSSQKLIQLYLDNKVLKQEHPQQLGKPLLNNLRGLWRYRVDQFRIICEIKEQKLTILAQRHSLSLIQANFSSLVCAHVATYAAQPRS